MVQVEARPASPLKPIDSPAASLMLRIPLSWYPLAFIALVVVGFFLRIHRLGERALHHDESLHALYSWYLYVGRGYIHDPMMHGPWQFHWTALIYFLFGDSDFTARLAPVLFGTALIAAPYFLRHELGRAGALVAAILLTISPAFLYFSRFAREDIYFAAWNALIVIGFFGMIRTRQERYLYIAALGLAGGFATKEAIYISGFIFVSFFALVAIFFGRTAAGAQVRETLRGYSLWAYLKAVALTVGICAVLFTTFFTNMGDLGRCIGEIQQLAQNHRPLPSRCGGLWTGTAGALLYWIEQHDVQRGGQPWFYYAMLIPLYEFVPLVLAGAALVTRRAPHNLFTWFCLWWAALAMLIYSYAGEKMPWITPHIVLPMILLGSQFLGGWLERIDLDRLRRPASLWVVAAGCLALGVALAAVGLGAYERLSPLQQQEFMLERLTFAVVLVGLVGVVIWQRRCDPRALIGAPLALAGLGGLLAFYIHTSWQLSYKHGDIPVEMLVYVQSSPDVPQVVREIERIGFQTGQGKDLRILMDGGYTERIGGQSVIHEAVSWPFEWYLRDYRNRRYYNRAWGSDINLADYPVALIMAPNLDPVREQLDDYNGQKYRLNWWYPEDYKGLNGNGGWGLKWQVVWDGLRDPVNRARLLQYVVYRDLLNPPLGAREFYFFARKEIPALGPAPLVVRSSPQAPVIASSPRAAVLTSRADGATIFGKTAEGTSVLSQPKDLALGPGGRLYVVEAGAHRVTVFNTDGSVLTTWGRPGSGDGEFQEPWGIAVGPNGDVFVADTWNHRVQRFDSNGRLLTSWGGLADVQGATNDQPGHFWGPRDVALGPDGLVYVTDTGNKRIQVFDTEGRFVRAFGGEGAAPGQFQEPVGLAFDGETLLVADTWNGRVQRLDLSGRPLGSIPVAAWSGKSITHKPYLATDGRGRLLVTAPDAGSVVLFDSGGNEATVLRPEPNGPSLPTGLAVTQNGDIYVADGRSGAVVRLPAPR